MPIQRARLALSIAVAVIAACHPADEAHELSTSDGYVSAPDGARLYYRVIGRAPDTLIAVHGGPGETLASFDPALVPLAAKHALLLYDQRGNGRSSAVDDSTHLRVSYHLQDLESIRQHFGIQRAAILGHSWGGGLAALYAAQHPAAVSRLILVDPVPPRLHPYGAESAPLRMAGIDSATRARIAVLSNAALADTAHDRAGLCREFYGLYLRNYFVDPNARTRTVAHDCADSSYSLKRAYRVGVTTSTDWGDWVWDTLVTKIDVPVLVVHGRNDFIPLAGSAAWAAAFPQGRLLVIERSGHFPFIERADEFFPAVETFLSGGWPAAARREHTP